MEYMQVGAMDIEAARALSREAGHDKGGAMEVEAARGCQRTKTSAGGSRGEEGGEGGGGGALFEI